jgi:nucleotide-binding universal stress UspA family protein
MGYGKVLVPLDGSPLAEMALQHVVNITEPGGQVHLLSIMAEDRMSEITLLASTIAQPVSFSEAALPYFQSMSDPRTIQARREYLQRVGDVLEGNGFVVTVQVCPGHVIETIVSVARDDFDVIIMATHGRTGISRVALGSITEGVLHKSPCPVLIIPARAAKAE